MAFSVSGVRDWPRPWVWCFSAQYWLGCDLAVSKPVIGADKSLCLPVRMTTKAQGQAPRMLDKAGGEVH